MPRKSSNNAVAVSNSDVNPIENNTNEIANDVPKKKRMTKKDKEAAIKSATEQIITEPVTLVSVPSVSTQVTTKPKRGRKSKVELMASLNATTTTNTNTINTIHLQVDEKESLIEVVKNEHICNVNNDDNNNNNNNNNHAKSMCF
jgi:hypothetical protein